MSWVQATPREEHAQYIYAYGKTKTPQQQSSQLRIKAGAAPAERLGSLVAFEGPPAADKYHRHLQQISSYVTPKTSRKCQPNMASTRAFGFIAPLRRGRRGLARDRIRANLLIQCTCTRSTCNRSGLPVGMPGTLRAGGQREMQTGKYHKATPGIITRIRMMHAVY